MSYDLVQLLQEIGVDNLKYQLLSSSFHGDQKALKDKKTKRLSTTVSVFSFIAEEGLGPVCVEGKRNALVVWVDADKLQAAHARLIAVIANKAEAEAKAAAAAAAAAGSTSNPKGVKKTRGK